MSSRRPLFTVLLAGALLAGCGPAQEATQPTAAPPSPPAAATAAPATAVAPPTAPATSAPAATAAQAAPTVAQAAPTVAQAAPSTAPADGPYAGLITSRTPEGYQMLGDPAAPVTLVMYSDFL